MTLALLLALAIGTSPRRVVSMAPSLTDLVVALGQGDRLIGVSRFDDDPSFGALPRVGGYLDPNVEAVVRLRPDLVLVLEGVAGEPTLQALRASGLQVLPLRTDSLDLVQASLRALGQALDVAPQAEALWAQLQATLESVRQKTAQRPRIRVAIAVGYRPLMLAGRGSYLEPLLEDAGGENVSRSGLAWPTVGFETLMAAPPQVLIDGGTLEEDSSAQRMLSLLRQHGTRVVRLPDGELFRPGPRAIRALPELEAALQEKVP